MTEKVAIVGCYQTGYGTGDETHSLPDLVFNCASRLLGQHGLERTDIDLTVIACDDLKDGRSISSMVTAAPAGAMLQEFMKIQGGGAFALAHAYMSIRAAVCDLALVIGWSKVSEAPYDRVACMSLDPIYLRPVLDELSCKGLQAQRYKSKYGITEEQAALVTVKNRANACNNPFAHLREKVGIEDVLASELIASPIRRLNNSTISDGACAVLLASESKAREFEKPVFIRGVGWNTDAYQMGDRELGELASLRKASGMAYKMAGIHAPLGEIDLAEVFEVSSYHELMIYEALGFCPMGEGGRFIEQGQSQLNGRLPVNPSGGSISTNPLNASGLTKVAECYLQLNGEADGRQVKGANVALAHDTQGIACQQNCVVILSR